MQPRPPHQCRQPLQQAYYLRQPITGSAGAPGFRVLDAHHADDGRRIVYAAMDYGSGEARVVEIRGADRAIFQVLARGYAKTAQRVYFEGRVIAGADAASFEMRDVAAGEEADAQDHRRRHRRGQPLSEGAMR